ncbi:MAG: XRE family transcriptional regulator [Subdoligranulum sp.]|nr:XRE family transcriptional regulator [Subdoligranulum sp.]
MAIGERIHFFRTMRGMTQKYLGMALGFPEKSADVRLAQYENGSRTPKADVTAALAQALDVSPKALDVPDIDSYVGLMHTLFTLEDRYGLEVCECEDEVHLRVHIHKGRDAAELQLIGPRRMGQRVISGAFLIKPPQQHTPRLLDDTCFHIVTSY